MKEKGKDLVRHLTEQLPQHLTVRRLPRSPTISVCWALDLAQTSAQSSRMPYGGYGRLSCVRQGACSVH